MGKLHGRSALSLPRLREAAETINRTLLWCPNYLDSPSPGPQAFLLLLKLSAKQEEIPSPVNHTLALRRPGLCAALCLSWRHPRSATVTPRQARAEAYGTLPPRSSAHLAKTHMGTSDGLSLGLVRESDQRRAGSGCFENFGTHSI